VTDQNEVVIARWTAEGSTSRGLSGLLAAYHMRTEEEKGVAVADVTELPERYLVEISDPAAAFADGVVLMAAGADGPVGCVVVAPIDGSVEIKRLWVDPVVRGRGVASALVRAALRHAEEAGVDTVRLSVWEWRANAIALYERLGFTVTRSWDARDRLVCMERATSCARLF
jgi:putative acetyltransferase